LALVHAPPWQSCPHAPQLCGSLVVLTQPAAQQVPVPPSTEQGLEHGIPLEVVELVPLDVLDGPLEVLAEPTLDELWLIVLLVVALPDDAPVPPSLAPGSSL
jgi:hypothetical protein